MKNTRDFYNKTCSEWADKWYEDDSMLPYFKIFIDKLPKNPRILDLCCGAGYDTARIKSLGAEVVGIDFSEKSIEIAQERNPQIEFYVGDMLVDYSYIGHVDGITVIAGLIHLPTDKLRLAFTNCARVLNENGLMLISVKDGTGKRDSQSFVTIDGEEYDRDFYAHSKSELIQASEGIFEYVEDVLPDDDDLWKTYIFKKK